MSHEVIVYYLPGCPFSTRLRLALAMRRVPFTSVRFRDDAAGAAKVREVNDGNELSPTVRIGDVWLSNPPVKAVIEARRRWMADSS